MDTETIKPSRYERFKIETKPAPHVYQIPNKFDVSARKVRLAVMLVHEAFEYKLNKEVALSRPCIWRVQAVEAQVCRVHEVCSGIPAHYDGETF